MTTIGYFTSMIAWLGFFTAIFLSYFYYLKFRNQERRLLIEKGVDLKDLYKQSNKRFPWYVLGFSIIGCALGVFMGVFLFDYIYSISSDYLALFITMSALLLGAIGVIIGKNVEEKKQ